MGTWKIKSETAVKLLINALKDEDICTENAAKHSGISSLKQQ